MGRADTYIARAHECKYTERNDDYATKELRENEEGTKRLYKAIERGLVPDDATLQQELHDLKARRGGFAQKCLRLLVQEIRFTTGEVLLTGSYAALAHAVGQNGQLRAAGVPRFVPGRLAERGSN